MAIKIFEKVLNISDFNQLLDEVRVYKKVNAKSEFIVKKIGSFIKLYKLNE